MHDVLAQTLPFVALGFLASAMFSLGLDLTVRQITEPLRDKRLVASALVANIVLIPLIAIAITRIVPMDGALAIGMIVYALAAGTEGGPKFAQLARGNAGFAIGLLALLLSITVVLMPALLSLAVPGAHVDRGALIVKLLLAVAAPVGLGLFLRARFAGVANRLSVVMHRGSLALLCVFFLQVVYVNFDEMRALQSGALLGSLVFFVVGFSVAYAMGGPRRENRRTLAIMTFVRNAPISMTTASQVFAHDPGVLVMVTVLSALSAVIGVGTVVGLRRLGA
jgi:BASS family bile acid:Na+ symporter